jgi:hypothetical protein
MPIAHKSESVINSKERLSTPDALVLTFSINMLENAAVHFSYLYEQNTCHFITSLSSGSVMQYALKAVQNFTSVFANDCVSFAPHNADTHDDHGGPVISTNLLFSLNLTIDAEFNTNLLNTSSVEHQLLHSRMGEFVSVLILD